MPYINLSMALDLPKSRYLMTHRFLFRQTAEDKKKSKQKARGENQLASLPKFRL